MRADDATRTDGAPNITDVARVAGVSTSTVSRFLRGLPVRRQEDIAAAVAQLGYRPNAFARGLRSRVTQAVGVILQDITNPYLAAVVRGIQSVNGADEYNLYLVGANEHLPQTVADLGSRVDGIICAAAETPEVLEALQTTGPPVVLLEFEPVGEEHAFDAVVIDNHRGGRLAAEHLIELGHDRIGVIGGPLSTSPGRERFDGFATAVRDAGLTLDDRNLQIADFSSESGYQAAAMLLAGENPPTALFVVNNLMSLGALKYIHDLGIDIPGEVSFVGFDPIDWCELMHPSPTTVDRPRGEQGAIAMRLLQNRILGRGPASPRRIVLEPKLVVRESTGPPR